MIDHNTLTPWIVKNFGFSSNKLNIYDEIPPELPNQCIHAIKEKAMI